MWCVKSAPFTLLLLFVTVNSQDFYDLEDNDTPNEIENFPESQQELSETALLAQPSAFWKSKVKREPCIGANLAEKCNTQQLHEASNQYKFLRSAEAPGRRKRLPLQCSLTLPGDKCGQYLRAADIERTANDIGKRRKRPFKF